MTTRKTTDGDPSLAWIIAGTSLGFVALRTAGTTISSTGRPPYSCLGFARIRCGSIESHTENQHVHAHRESMTMLKRIGLDFALVRTGRRRPS